MTRHLAVLLVAVLALSTRPREVHDPSDPENLVPMYGSPEAAKIALAANQKWREHRFDEAAKLYERGYQDGVRRRNPSATALFLIGLGASDFATYKYRQALDRYLTARDVAVRAGVKQAAVLASSNLASLYLIVSDTTSAQAAIEEAYQNLPRGEDTPRRDQVSMVLGRVLSARGEANRAVALFEEVIESTSRRDLPQKEALAWHYLGWELLRSGALDRAEIALNTAFRLRYYHKDPDLFVTEHHLARLYLAKGDLDLARYAIEAAFARWYRNQTEIPEHWLYLTRAEILRAQGDLEGSFDNYLQAMAAIDDWRRRGLSADAFRISTDIFLHEIYNGAIDAAAGLYQRTGNRRFAEMAWQLDERIRAGSLREQLQQGHDWTGRLPSEYWQVLDRLREVNAEQFAAPSPARLREAARLRMHLAEMEARASAEIRRTPAAPATGGAAPTHLGLGSRVSSPENLLPRDSLIHVQTVLGNSRTLISFHVGEQRSYRWLVAGNRLELKFLPGRRELRRDVDGLRSQLVNGTGPVGPAALKVYSDLFSDVSGTDKSPWSLALDGDLFELPVAALVTAVHDNRPKFLIEERAVEIVPGAWAVEPVTGREQRGFVGIGDGVYNSADPRYVASTAARPWFGWVARPLQRSPEAVELPRLVASRREVEACARLARGPTMILTGIAATRRQLISALGSKPGIVHIAAHYLTSRTEEKATAIALGLNRDPAGGSRLEILTPDDIASLRVPGAVVVMSGCSSAAGRIVPVAGLLGLARAWMAAGASAVVATQWPTPDDTGELFAKFYAHLRDSDSGEGVTPAEALRRAQVDTLRSAGSGADPRLWAAYEILGRSQ